MNFFKLIALFIPLFFGLTALTQTNVTVTVDTGNKTAAMSNGIVSLTINSKGQVNTLTHNGVELLDASSGGKFYFSYNDQDSYKELSPTAVRVQKQTDDYAEVVYSNTSGNIKVEQAFILRRDVSGLYCYVTVEGTANDVKLREMRVVYRVSPSLFTYGYVTDEMQGELPSVEVMKAVNDTPIMDATYKLPDGSIYTKYDWANYIVRDSVHGIMSASEGLWAMSVSNEYMNGGPMKQELTVHTTNKTPLVLQMLQGEHFGASAQNYKAGDKKIYGPFFIYLNSGESHEAMIADAKAQSVIQKEQWPFQWLDNPLYPTNRTTVTGKIKLQNVLSPKGIQVVLAQSGSEIYYQGKEYMFWSKTDRYGDFNITNVRPGNYTLYAYATEGEITDELAVDNITVEGELTNLEVLDWSPVKYENFLWLIGENDRMSTGFKYADHLRSYGLYDLPPAYLNFTVGTSTAENNWYYAQTKEGVWTISFTNDKTFSGYACLTASIAGAANSPSVSVNINGTITSRWDFSNDGSIYRSAVLGGRHGVRTSKFPASLIKIGTNTIQLKMTNVGNRGGVIYDCIKLEAGDLLTSNKELSLDNAAAITVANYPNPFSQHTTIEVNIPKVQSLKVSVYNSLGQFVACLFDGNALQGKSQFEWVPLNQKPGMYYYRVQTNEQIISRKMIYAVH